MVLIRLTFFIGHWDRDEVFQVIFQQGPECVRPLLVEPLSLQQLLILMEVKQVGRVQPDLRTFNCAQNTGSIQGDGRWNHNIVLRPFRDMYPHARSSWGADGLLDLRGARGCDTGQIGHGVHNFSVSQICGCIIVEPNGLVHRLEGDFHRHGSYSSDIFHWPLGQGRGVFIFNSK